MRPKAHLLAASLLATTALVPAAADAATEIGVAKRVVVRAYGTVPGETTEPLFVRDPLFVDERIETSAKSRALLEFNDQTELWIGEKSEVVLDAFIYDAETSAGEFVAALGTGLFRFVTGELQSEGFTIATPVATIGVRGTDFSVLVEQSGATTAACYAGAICIKPIGGREVCIEAGQTGTVAGVGAAVAVSDSPFATPPRGVADIDPRSVSGGAGGGAGGGGEAAVAARGRR